MADIGSMQTTFAPARRRFRVRPVFSRRLPPGSCLGSSATRATWTASSDYAGITPAMAGSTTSCSISNRSAGCSRKRARLTRNDNFGLIVRHQVRAARSWSVGIRGRLGADAQVRTRNARRTLPASSAVLVDAPRASCAGMMRLEYRIETAEISSGGRMRILTLGQLGLDREALGQTWSPDEVHFEHPGPKAGGT